ncbi:MAG: molybdopterin oxidoreductase family protein [Actinobacteria bacterium]|nr:MAG: molybdopterin oxidoreductase family protein [Actinomycetota bacterium]
MSIVDQERVVYRTCPLCEATCGLEITVKGDKVSRIRGDRDDVLSHGFICPKGSTLKQLHEDPDRLRKPLIKRNGEHVEVSWQEAWAEVERGLMGVINTHGRGSVGTYVGNPNAHNLAPLLYNRVWMQAIGTRQRFSASSVDQLPKQIASAYMFGTVASVAIPDLDRTDYVLMLGANPYASNGSLCTAPDFPGRLEALRARGGKLVVVDPRRSKTAQEADEWLAIRPNGDALLLAALANTIFASGKADVGDHVRSHVAGFDELPKVLAPFTPEAVAHAVGIDATTIRRIAGELCDAPTALVYGRIGTTTVTFGTTASWLIDVINTITGNLDKAGGVMFPLPAAGNLTTRGESGRGKGFRIGHGYSRVRQSPEAIGEYPVSVMAEEILTTGDGQIRAMVTVAGNPVLSTPNGAQLDKAFESLEFMVAVDIYLNETTRHANVILPPPSHLERSHYDMVFTAFSIRNVANFSEAVFEREADQPDEWQILAKLAGIAQGAGSDVDPVVIDDYVYGSLLSNLLKDKSSPLHGRSEEEIRALVDQTQLSGPERILDTLLRSGPYGDAFGANPKGISLQTLRDQPHGVDFGALEPRIPEVLRTPSGKVELAPTELVADVERLEKAMHDVDTEGLLLVGRRHLRSNNSWMHNISVLVKGKPRCTLQMHPGDAQRAGIVDGGRARITSRVGSVDAVVEVTQDIRERVVSLPHGWGHAVRGTKMRVAAERAGVNSNVLTDEDQMDPLSGTSVLNGIPVTVAVVIH